MILIIDNYDSFTYNLAALVRDHADGEHVRVLRNDVCSVDSLERREPSSVLFSPGPGRPEDAGFSMDLIRALCGQVPILGVCLGHQCLAEVFGWRVVPARKLMHGKTSLIHHESRGMFAGLPSPMCVMRYHSLAVKPPEFGSDLEVVAWTDDGEVMGIQHRHLPLWGVQFHPESFLSEQGDGLMRNFLKQRKSTAGCSAKTPALSAPL